MNYYMGEYMRDGSRFVDSSDSKCRSHGRGRSRAHNNRRSGSSSPANSNNGSGGSNSDGAADVRVVADEENNSLMIYSTGMQYKTIKAAVEKLDVPPTGID